MLQPEKFICISYPRVDFLIPNEYVVSAVSVKDLDITPEVSQTTGFFDFDRIASTFRQNSREANIKTMIVLRTDSDEHLSLITAQECRVCTIPLKSFSLFSDIYFNAFKKLGLLACSFEEDRIRFLIDVKKITDCMNASIVEEL